MQTPRSCHERAVDETVRELSRVLGGGEPLPRQINKLEVVHVVEAWEAGFRGRMWAESTGRLWGRTGAMLNVPTAKQMAIVSRIFTIRKSNAIV